ncbi:helix-turn-helix transcriptional regulator [Actinobaculum sp. 352]|uniref:helix-turn-helix domain-containing protein n=1 Tax=Actinobaculum sp. 352 TaxID=2490946 RepID=UPI000F7F6D68|nr:helix-turn-helix transcriptional regulator [Actinobaculum sp. 352]RTE49339.1 XRE family transcriptional regulator [Actinobaculum sp. 352]
MEKDPLLRAVIVELRAEMARQKISQREVANRIGVSAQYLSELLNGTKRLRAALLHKAAQTLGLDMETLYARAEAAMRAAEREAAA